MNQTQAMTVLFGEAEPYLVIAIPSEASQDLENAAVEGGFTVIKLGTMGGDALEIRFQDGGIAMDNQSWMQEYRETFSRVVHRAKDIA